MMAGNRSYIQFPQFFI